MSKIMNGLNGAFATQSSGTDAEQAARVAGYTDALMYHGIAVPAEILMAKNGAKAYAWMMSDMKKEIMEQLKKQREIAASELAEIYNDPDATAQVMAHCRAALLDASNVDSNGYRCDAKGTALEDNNYHSTVKDVPEWTCYTFQHKITGDEIGQGDYDKLGGSEKANYEKLAYFYITTKTTGTSRITVAQAEYIDDLIALNISKHPGVANRFACEIGTKPDKTTGKLYAYRNEVIKALQQSDPVIYDDRLCDQLRSGHINSIGQLRLAILESLIYGSASTTRLSPDRLDWCLTLVESMNDRTRLDDFFPQADRLTYVDADGESLKTMVREADGGCKLVDSTTTNDDGCVIYIECLLKQLAERLNNDFIIKKSQTLPVDDETMGRIVRIAAACYPTK